MSVSNQEGPSNGLSDGRVRFAAEQLDQHDLEIIVKYPNEESIDVHLGFLEINRVYEVKFIIKDNLGEDIEADPLQNLHARLQFSMPTEDGEGHDLLIQLTAHKEKLMKEKLIIKSCSDNSRQLVLILNARVLGKGKGKPALKNGIKCILRNTEDDSEYTDWQGFD